MTSAGVAKLQVRVRKPRGEVLLTVPGRPPFRTFDPGPWADGKKEWPGTECSAPGRGVGWGVMNLYGPVGYGLLWCLRWPFSFVCQRARRTNRTARRAAVPDTIQPGFLSGKPMTTDLLDLLSILGTPVLLLASISPDPILCSPMFVQQGCQIKIFWLQFGNPLFYRPFQAPGEDWQYLPGPLR